MLCITLQIMWLTLLVLYWQYQQTKLLREIRDVLAQPAQL